MATTFPIQLASWFQNLRVESATFELTEAMEYSETGGGEVYTSSYGPRLWEMTVTVPVEAHGQADDNAAVISLLREPGASFLAHPPHYIGPQFDPAGTVIGAASPVLASVNVNMQDINITGLPASFQVRRGDYVSWTYGGRRALHRFTQSVTASAGGVITAIEVRPAVRPGFAANEPLTFVRPRAAFVIVPGSVQPVTYGIALAEGLRFTARQSLRP